MKSIIINNKLIKKYKEQIAKAFPKNANISFDEVSFCIYDVAYEAMDYGYVIISNINIDGKAFDARFSRYCKLVHLSAQ